MGDTRSHAQLLTALTQAEDALRAECERADAADLLARQTAAMLLRSEASNADMRAALELTQFGFAHRRCPVCAGMNVGPNGETDRRHTKTCPVAKALSSDAGRDMRAVVEAAELMHDELCQTLPETYGELNLENIWAAVRKYEAALAALGGK